MVGDFLGGLIVDNFNPDNPEDTQRSIANALQERIEEHKRIVMVYKKEDIYSPLVYKRCKEILKDITFEKIEDINDRTVYYRLNISDDYFGCEDYYNYSNRYYRIREKLEDEKEEFEQNNSIKPMNENLHELVFNSKIGDSIMLFINGKNLDYYRINDIFTLENNEYVSLIRLNDIVGTAKFYKYVKKEHKTNPKESLVPINDIVFIEMLKAFRTEKK